MTNINTRLSLAFYRRFGFSEQTNQELAEVAVSVINQLGLINPKDLPMAELVVQGDGIEDGVTRMELLGAVTDRDTLGTEVEVRYRGQDLGITFGMDDTYVAVQDIGFSVAFRVADTDRGSDLMRFIRDLDLFIDMVEQDTVE